MTPYPRSIRDAAVLLVNAAAWLAEAVLERADAIVCAAGDAMSEEEE